MPMPRKYTDEIYELVHAARKAGVPWAKLEERYGSGIRVSYYNRHKLKYGSSIRQTVWYPASYYREHGLPNPYE